MTIDVFIDRGVSEIDWYGIRIWQPMGESVWYVADKSQGALYEFDNLADAVDRADSI
tara:strand:+ start:3430 stop:3600 length:171 start_codon:yes stop_codon:yes gene_type:complete